MSNAILLAVDVGHYAPDATDAACELARESGGLIVVLHVHEFATGRFGRLQVDCPVDAAEALLPQITSQLRAAGVAAQTEVREARLGHVAEAVLAAAEDHDARVIVLGSPGRTDLPRLALGSMSHHLLHQARRPVMIVPRRLAAAPAAEPAESAASPAG